MQQDDELGYLRMSCSPSLKKNIMDYQKGEEEERGHSRRES
jgi:hypothetical protein